MTNEELVMKIKSGEDVKQNMEQLHNQLKNFIRKIAWKYKQDDELADLMQEGFLALYDAVEGYDPAEGVTFLHYASFYIKSRLARYIENSGSCIRIPVHKQEEIRKYQRFCNQYYLEHGCEPPTEVIAQLMHLSIEQVEQIRESACMARLGSLDKTIKEEEDETIGDFVRDPFDQMEDADERIYREQLKTVLWGCVDELPEEQAKAIRARYRDGLTLKETGERLGVNAEGARQCEAKGLRELRKPSRAKRIRPFFEESDRIFSMGTSGTGVGVFERTWTSATERAVINRLEKADENYNNSTEIVP